MVSIVSYQILGRSCSCMETENGVHSAPRELRSSSELCEPNYHSGIAMNAKKANFTTLTRNEKIQFPEENQMCGGSIVLKQSKLEFSYSAFSIEHSNSIGNIYTVVIDMQCASSVFYMY